MNRFYPALVLAVATTLVAAAAASAPAQTALATSPSTLVQSGDQSRWALDFHSEMVQSAGHPIEIHMIGSWTTTISAVRDGEYDAQLQGMRRDADALRKWWRSRVSVRRRMTILLP